MGIWRIVALSALVGWAPTSSAAQEDVRSKLNNFSHDLLFCGVYFAAVAQCLENTPKFSATAKKYREVSDLALGEAILAGEAAGVSERALSAKATLASQEMMADMEGSCSNVSVINLKHMDRCTEIFSSRMDRLKAIAR